MKVQVQLFAQARDLAGGSDLALQLPAGACVGDLKKALVAQFPRLAGLAPSLLVAVNDEYAGDSAPVEAGSLIACFPPVSGG